MSQSLDDIITDAKDSFRDIIGDNKEDDFQDEIHEVADGAVPVYTGDLMQLAADNIELATATPDCGPAFGGEPTSVNIVAANVYEAITAALYEEWKVIEDERQEAEDAAIEAEIEAEEKGEI